MRFEDLRVGEYVVLNEALKEETKGTEFEQLFEAETYGCVLEITSRSSGSYSEDCPSAGEVELSCVQDCGMHAIDHLTEGELEDIENVAGIPVLFPSTVSQLLEKSEESDIAGALPKTSLEKILDDASRQFDQIAREEEAWPEIIRQR